MDYMQELEEKGRLGKEAARKLAVLSTKIKDQALIAIAAALMREQAAILAANAQDVAAARAAGIKEAMIDRLALNEKRIADMAEGLRQIAGLTDPVGEILGVQRRPNGLEIGKVRVPLGVIGIIYEARPNVTVDAAGLCLKTGNAVILRGGSEAVRSNTAIAKVIQTAATLEGIPAAAVQMIETTDREAVKALLKLNRWLDVVIPRGGAGLIRMVVENATVPVIQTGTGVCHTFVDETADLAMAAAIAFNAKVSRPAVCNAMETLLVHKQVADAFLPKMLDEYRKAGVELRGCPVTCGLGNGVLPATEADWATEYSDLILSVKVVDGIEAAIAHINRYGTGHSECIVTRDYNNARKFQREVDAAAVYVNASTRFTDGFEFGFGAEIGISTQKLHARGPMGLVELTSIKYLIWGDGQIR